MNEITVPCEFDYPITQMCEDFLRGQLSQDEEERADFDAEVRIVYKLLPQYESGNIKSFDFIIHYWEVKLEIWWDTEWECVRLNEDNFEIKLEQPKKNDFIPMALLRRNYIEIGFD